MRAHVGRLQVRQRRAETLDGHAERLRLSIERMLHRLGGERAGLRSRVQLGVGRRELQVESLEPRIAPDVAQRLEEALHRLDVDAVALRRPIHVAQLRRVAREAELGALEGEDSGVLGGPVEHQHGAGLFQSGEIVEVG